MAFIRHDAVEWPKQLLYFKSSYKCENKMPQVTSVPSWTPIGLIRGDTWVSYLYLIQSSFECL